MGRHFAQIGFPGETQDDFVGNARLVIREGTRTPVGDVVSVRFADPSGAGGDVVLRQAGIDCAKPTFLGEPGATVRIGPVNPDESCEWCSTVWLEVLEDGDPVYPALVEVAGFAEVRPALTKGTECRASLALFAAELRSHQAAPGDLADQAAVPTGTMGDRPRAEMLLTGYVRAAERRRNTLTGAEFGWARVDSYAATYDVLLPASAPLPEAGTVVWAGGWLVASLDLSPREHRRRWWRR